MDIDFEIMFRNDEEFCRSISRVSKHLETNQEPPAYSNKENGTVVGGKALRKRQVIRKVTFNIVFNWRNNLMKVFISVYISVNNGGM